MTGGAEAFNPGFCLGVGGEGDHAPKQHMYCLMDVNSRPAIKESYMLLYEFLAINILLIEQ